MIAKPPPADDCEAIRQALYRYCRGIDRCDREALESCYWPEAIDDHASFRGPAAEFIDVALTATRSMTTAHMIGNVLIESDGENGARVESYFHATHRLPDTGEGPSEWTLIGRYLDRFARRGGEWRILDRMVVVDHERRSAVTAPSDDFQPRPEALGHKKPDDPLYRRG